MTPARFGRRFVALASAIAFAGGCNEAPPIPPNPTSASSPSNLPATSPPNTAIPAGGEDAGSFASFTVEAGSAMTMTLPPGAPPGRMGPRPSFGTTVMANRPPPPISGGTLLVTHDGNTTIASDPDRDAVYVIDVGARTVSFTIPLQPGDEPGRVAEDGTGRVHVALRSGGALVSIDPKTGTILTRRAVCPAPRGVAWDASSDVVWVACATGELVALPSAGGVATHSFVIERDLRDVIIQKGAIAVTTFRSAEVLRIAQDGTVSRRDSLVTAAAGAPPSAPSRPVHPRVAWRAVAAPSGSIVIVHQEESTSPITTKSPNAYGASGMIVEGALTMMAGDGTSSRRPASGLPTVPVDVAVTPDGAFAAVISAGAALSSLDKVVVFPLGGTLTKGPPSGPSRPSLPADTQPIAIGFDATGDLLVQSREPAQLWVTPAGGAPTSIVLSTISRKDTGHDVFHAQAGGFIACASCHPEGGDDGHLWLLDGAPRRTPSLRGTIAGTAPYHWPGDEVDLAALTKDVYSGRMSGAALDASQMKALTGWLESIPAPPAPSWVDQSAALRGRVAFEGVAGCTTCHSGAKFTNNATMGVGTGGSVLLVPGDAGFGPGTDTANFQVPSLIGVGWRTPLMHDGCAHDIADRFGRCATPTHGSTAQLSAQNIVDLTAYLETL